MREVDAKNRSNFTETLELMNVVLMESREEHSIVVEEKGDMQSMYKSELEEMRNDMVSYGPGCRAEHGPGPLVNDPTSGESVQLYSKRGFSIFRDAATRQMSEELREVREEMTENERKCRMCAVKLAAGPPTHASGPMDILGAGVGSLSDTPPAEGDARPRPCFNHGKIKLGMHQALSKPEKCQCCRRQCTEAECLQLYRDMNVVLDLTSAITGRPSVPKTAFRPYSISNDLRKDGNDYHHASVGFEVDRPHRAGRGAGGAPDGGEIMMAEVVTMDQRNHHFPFRLALMKATSTLKVRLEDGPRDERTDQ